MKRISSFLERLNLREPLIGSLVTTRSPEIAETLSLSGFDWLMLDLEHSTLDIASAQQIIQTVSHRTYVVIRLPNNSSEHFKRALDTGCDGVIVPLINSAAEAETAVKSAKYPPLGNRGVGLARAQGYGFSLDDYLKTANSTVALILQIEDKEAVSDIDNILAVSGFDAVFIGPYDLSGSMNLLGRTTAPEVVAAIKTVRQACAKADVPWGTLCMTTSQAQDELALGARLMVVGTDLSFTAKGAKAVISGLSDRNR